MNLMRAFAELDAESITAIINEAFPRAVAAAIARHEADGTIEMLSDRDARDREMPPRG